MPDELKERIPAEIRQRMAANLDEALQQAPQVEVGRDDIVVQQVTASKVLDYDVKDIQFRR